MRILPLTVAALAFGRCATSENTTTSCKMPLDTAAPGALEGNWKLGLPFMGMGKATQSDTAEAKRASGQAFAPYSTQQGMCLDVQNNRLESGSAVQLWQCNGGQANQAWRQEGPLFQANNDMCLDLPWGNAYSGAKLQVWKCDGNNKNQHWQKLGNSLQWQGGQGNYCLDVTNGFFRNGNPVQLWSCYPGSANQGFTASKSAASGGVSTGASDFHGYRCISLDDFIKKYPWCAEYKGAFQSAGANQGINPVFLGALSMAESTCGAGLKNSPLAWAGPFQFTDNGAWSFYGGQNKDRINPWDAAYGAARYYNALLKQTNGNLYQAMRLYNGEVANGGSASYQSDIAGFMSGTK